MTIQGNIPRPPTITHVSQPVTFTTVVTAETINDAMHTHRCVTTAAGDHILDRPLLYPPDKKSFNWDDPGGASYALKGPGASHTRMWAEHGGKILQQGNAHQHGVYFGPEVKGLTFIGNDQTPVGLALDGWRRGELNDVVVMGIPNGLGCFIDGTTTGGSWYNVIHRCRFGDLRNDPRYWVRQGLRLGGFNGQGGKTNECTVNETQFLNCWDWGLGLTGVGAWNADQNGINGGAAMNHSQGCTFYAQQALFKWDAQNKPLYKPIGVYHDSDGGHTSFGDYFERLYTPLRQSARVDDYRFNIPLATIKNSGYFTPAKVNAARCEAYREGGGDFRMGQPGWNAWTKAQIERNWV